MKRIFKDNLKRITALLLVVIMVMPANTLVFAEDIATQKNNELISKTPTELENNDKAEKSEPNGTPKPAENPVIGEENPDKVEEAGANSTPKPAENPVIEGENPDKVEEAGANNTPGPVEKPALKALNIGKSKMLMSRSVPESDEAAREKECISNYKNGASNPEYLKKFLTYLSLKYPEIYIDPQYGTGGNPTPTGDSELDNWYNATKMGRQTKYDTIEINGHDYPDTTKNMVQFRYLSNFDGSIGGTSGNNHTVKTLIIRNVDEIRNLYIPEYVETLIIENTTINCYETPGFQCGSYGDLKYCKNLKELVLKNVKFGDKYKNPEPEISEFDTYQYEKNYKINLQDCPNLEKLEIDVSFNGAEDVKLAIDGGADNLFPKLTAANCKINPAPGTGYGQVKLYANPNSNLAKCYESSETVKFKSELFRLWLLNATGVDSNRDGVISQAELDAIGSLEINDQTAHYARQTSLRDFQELADIKQMHGLKTLKLDFYDPSDASNGNRQTLYGIDFPDSLENLSMRNIYWKKDTEKNLHTNADITFENLRTLELYNIDVDDKANDSSYFSNPTRIALTDTEGVLSSCIIENTDVESIKLINNSNGKGIKNQDEKQRIKFSAANCQNLKTIEFLGEGYAVEGSLDLTNDTALTHIGVPNEGRTQWTVYGEFDSTYAPVNVILNSCSNLGSDCAETIIDYDFINGRDLNVQALDTRFSNDHKLIIFRNPRISGDTAGNVYLSCDNDGGNVWVYNEYNGKTGFIIENRSSFPTIAVFSNGQRIRTSGDGNHNNDSSFTEDSERWVERWDLVMSPKGYSNDFGNLTFYVVDKTVDGAGNRSESLRKVFYKGDVYVEWEQQGSSDPIITLPTEKVVAKNAYKLNGTKISSTGTSGEVELKLYIYNDDGSKLYIGYQNIKVFKMPSSVELVNDGTMRGSGTKDDPYIVGKNEELKLKARLLVSNGENTEVDRAGDFALRDVIWRIKEYDETPKYTSDSDGYSLYTLDSATRAGIDVVRGQLNPGETEEQYDKRKDNIGPEPTFYNHRRFVFNTTGTKFKIVAQSPYKYNADGSDRVIASEIYVVCNNSNNSGGGSSGGGNQSGEKPSDGNSGGDNSGSGNPSQSSVPVYTVSAGTIPSGTIPVYSTIPVDPVKDPEKPTLGLPVIEKKNPGVYVIPDITKNEVVYMAPPVDNTRKTITIPDRIVINGQVMSVVKIDPGAFKNNENIETIKIGKNIKVIGNGAFEGATNLKRIALGRNVETIGDGAFKGCTKLTTVTIPNKTTKIGASAFEGDTKLRNITIGKNVESIGDFAFKDCVSLTSIIIPSKVTNIGVAVFAGCTKLNTLKIVSKKLTSIGVAFGAFYGLTERTTIRAPWSMLNTYRGLFEEKGIISTVKIKRY